MSNSERGKLQTALRLHQAGQLEGAAKLYRQVIAKEPQNAQAVHYLGLIAAATGKNKEADTLLRRSLQIEPRNMQFLENCATTLLRMGDYSAALDMSERGVRLNGSYPSILYVRALSLYKLKRLREAVAVFDRLLALAPDHVAAVNERGSVLAELRDYEGAVASFEKALALQPRYAEAIVNKGNIFGALNNHDAALAAFDEALALKPGLAEAWVGRAQVLGDLERHREALSAYDRALALKADFTPAWIGRGNVLLLTKQYREAFTAYDRAVALNPDQDYVSGARLFVKLSLCDWTNLAAETAELLTMVRRQAPASTPFHFLAIASSAADQWECAKRNAQDQPRYPSIRRDYAHKRIRLAYLSGDFREHPVGYLTAGLFEHHDKARFETTAISVGADRDSPTRNRIEKAFERFIDVDRRSDQEIASLIGQFEIDVLVDLMGFTTRNRLGVLARRPAPVQVNYLGYSGTMGADYFDYILADATVIPEEHCQFYTEQVVWLPDCYLVNDDRRVIAERVPSRRECGLPEDGFVFCCFNNPYKFAPETFRAWMRLLQAVPSAVLWLAAPNAMAQDNLRRTAERLGIAPERVVFARQTPGVAEHLARLRQADLFLDTLPYNAHTTACDALWAGLPVLTCLGSTFAGRVAASLLKAVGLDELITHSLEEYEALALKLAHDPAYLASVRARLARNRETFPLFDTARTARNIEAAYTMMWERYQRGEPPKLSIGRWKPIQIA